MNGLRFGNLPTPFPDENCYSILCRFAVRRGQIKSTQVIHDLFRNSVNIRLGSYLFKPFKLRDIQDWYGSNEIPIQYGANHSCYPYYTMFLSPLFRSTLATLCDARIELFDTDGSLGAARGAALGAGIYKTTDEAFATLERLDVIEPEAEWKQPLETAYGRWKQELTNSLKY